MANKNSRYLPTGPQTARTSYFLWGIGTCWALKVTLYSIEQLLPIQLAHFMLDVKATCDYHNMTNAHYIH